MHYLLIYDLTPDYLERRGEFRAAHLELAWASSERGELVLGGALAEPTDKAYLLFDTNKPEVVERFAQEDPYVKSGLVASWQVRLWTTVVGELAASPVR